MKNYLKTQMSQDGLNALAVLSIESHEAEYADFDTAIHYFATKNKAESILIIHT